MTKSEWDKWEYELACGHIETINELEAKLKSKELKVYQFYEELEKLMEVILSSSGVIDKFAKNINSRRVIRFLFNNYSSYSIKFYLCLNHKIPKDILEEIVQNINGEEYEEIIEIAKTMLEKR